MSGYFQRSPLQPNTFQGNKQTGGLKAAFENRVKQVTMPEIGTMPESDSHTVNQHLRNESSEPHVRYGNTEILYHRTDSVDTNPSEENVRNFSGDEHSMGLHSIHRLRGLNNAPGGNLKRAFEARTGGTTRRTLGGSRDKDAVLEKHANLIVTKMEQDEALMEDSPDAEELRRTALRDMPQCLTIKRSVKVKLSKSVSQKSRKKTLSYFKMFKYRISMGISKFKIDIKDLAYSLELWYGPLKKIEGNFGTGVASFFKLLRWLFLVNLTTAIVSLAFIVLPKVSYDSGVSQPLNGTFMMDIITGEGYITHTSMFYGFYTNQSINTIPGLTYSMSHAYFFTMFFIYLVSFLVLGISAARSYRRSFIETEGGLKNVFANKIFCGWDYNIATKDAADLKSRAIFNELRELLSNFAWSNKRHTFYEKFLTFVVRFCMNTLIVFIMFATGYAIWYFLDKVAVDRSTLIIIIPVFINFVMTLMPMLFSFLVKYEDYKNPKTGLYLTLVRTFLLGGVTVGVLVTYWIKNPNSNSSCWETSIGQEIYRMVIFDFFISVLCAAILDIILYNLYKFRKNANLEFDIAWNTMQIIYNQTLFWVGLVFSPLLPIMVVIKLFLTWYIRQFVVLVLCKPSARSWRATETSTWFLVLTFLSLLFVGGFVGYIISCIPVSTDCGPFTNYKYMYEIVTLGVFQLKSNNTVWQVLLYVTKPGVIAIILIALGVKVYYLKAQAEAQKEMVAQCRDMLNWSAKDKELYYSLISQVTKGQWQYKLNDRNGDPTLWTPEYNSYTEAGDINRGQSISSPYWSRQSSSASTGIGATSSTMSLGLDFDNPLNSRYKKYS